MSWTGIRGALLCAFLVTSGVPFFVFWIWPHSAALENEMQEVRERHLLLAKNVSAALENFDRDVRLHFESLAPLLVEGKDMSFAAAMLDASHFRHMCVVDPETGRVLNSFVRQGAVPDVMPPGLVRMVVALANEDEVRISPVVVPKEGAAPMLFLAKWEQGNLVIAAIDNRFFTSIAGRVSFGGDGHAAIVDSEGSVLAHPRQQWVDSAKNLSRLEPVRRMRNGESGVITFFSPAIQEEVVAGYAPVPGAGWGVMVPQPVAELQATAQRIGNSAGLVFLSGLALSAIIAILVSAHFARGLNRVSNAALRLARGEEGVRVPNVPLYNSLREVADLGRCFNAMAVRVEDARARAVQSASRDHLTGLLNRGAFLEQAGSQLRKPDAENQQIALYFIDVDNLKQVNDTSGHAAGDRILNFVAQALRSVASKGDLLARQSGDEFLLFCRRRASAELDEIDGRLTSLLCNRPLPNGHAKVARCSIGRCDWPGRESDLGSLVSNADRAMYEAKQNGGGALRHFDETLRGIIDRKAQLQKDLTEALQEDSISVEYQPILSTGTGGLVGFEALARWKRSDGRIVPAETFVSAAEENGLICELGRHVRRKALRFSGQLHQQGILVPISLNVSHFELICCDLIAQLEEELEQNALPKSAVILEFTESFFDSRTGISQTVVNTLKQRGFVLALDDFGKGMSSHNRLLNYPVDQIKIDLLFAGDVSTRPEAAAVVTSLVELGRSLKKRVTIECVETEAHDAFVRNLGANDMQGNLHAAPMTEKIALSFARQKKRHRTLARTG